MTNEQYLALYQTALSEIKGIMEKHGLSGSAIVFRPPQELERHHTRDAAMASFVFVADTTLFDQSSPHAGMAGVGRIKDVEDYDYNEERYEEARQYSLKTLHILAASGRQVSHFSEMLRDKIEHRSIWSLFRL